MSAEIYSIPVEKISGEPASLGDFKGKVVLVVNVASKCGLTPQYEGLEKLYEQYRGQGLVIAGFPANDFKSQEPGTNDEIQSFCKLNYGDVRCTLCSLCLDLSLLHHCLPRRCICPMHSLFIVPQYHFGLGLGEVIAGSYLCDDCSFIVPWSACHFPSLTVLYFFALFVHCAAE